MGFGAAFVMPATLSIITNVFPPQERAKAIAVWAGIAAGGAALGPIASGFLLRALLVGLGLPRQRADRAGRARRRLLHPADVARPRARAGSTRPVPLLSILGLGALVYAIIEAPDHGWASAETLLAFGLAVVVLAAFIWWEMQVQRTPCSTCRCSRTAGSRSPRAA